LACRNEYIPQFSFIIAQDALGIEAGILDDLVHVFQPLLHVVGLLRHNI